MGVVPKLLACGGGAQAGSSLPRPTIARAAVEAFAVAAGVASDRQRGSATRRATSPARVAESDCERALRDGLGPFSVSGSQRRLKSPIDLFALSPSFS